jgi:hypothetical protein
MCRLSQINASTGYRTPSLAIGADSRCILSFALLWVRMEVFFYWCAISRRGRRTPHMRGVRHSNDSLERGPRHRRNGERAIVAKGLWKIYSGPSRYCKSPSIMNNVIFRSAVAKVRSTSILCGSPTNYVGWERCVFHVIATWRFYIMVRLSMDCFVS